MSFIEKAKETSVRAHGEVIARLIVDTNKDKILFVPANKNHAPFLAAHLGKNIKEVEQQPDLVSPFVSVVVRFEGDLAEEVMVGISGLELYFTEFKSPLHTKKQVNKARNLILATLQACDLLAKGFKLRMIYE